MTATRSPRCSARTSSYRYHPLRRADPRPRRGRRLVAGERRGPGRRPAPTRPSYRAGRGRRRRRRGHRHQHLHRRAGRRRSSTIYDNCFVIRFDDGRAAAASSPSGSSSGRAASVACRAMTDDDKVYYDADANPEALAGQDDRDPRLRLAGPRPRAQPEGVGPRRRRRAAPRLVEPREGRGGGPRGARHRRRRQPRRHRHGPAARREAGRDLERRRSPTGSPRATC